MSLSLPVSASPGYAVAERALRRWAAERLRSKPRAGGGAVYTFALTGSTCTNRPIEVEMTVTVDADGRIDSATAAPAPHDTGCGAMCAATAGAQRFFAESGGCDEAVGLTLHEAAFRDWQDEPSGCFCTAGNRRHKWRNVFQTLHFALCRGQEVNAG